jgi:type I restriction enzyme S subunit
MISELSKVPSQWKKVKFEDIIENITDRIDNPQEAGLSNYIGLEHLDTDGIRIKRYGSPNDVQATKFLCKKGDIIFGKRRAYLRKLAVTERDAVVSAHSMVLRPKAGKIYSDFLPWFLHSSQF